MWGESEWQAILPKTKGSGIMVSDFVEENGGFIELSPEAFKSAKSKCTLILSLLLGVCSSMVQRGKGTGQVTGTVGGGGGGGITGHEQWFLQKAFRTILHERGIDSQKAVDRFVLL